MPNRNRLAAAARAVLAWAAFPFALCWAIVSVIFTRD